MYIFTGTSIGASFREREKPVEINGNVDMGGEIEIIADENISLGSERSDRSERSQFGVVDTGENVNQDMNIAFEMVVIHNVDQDREVKTRLETVV